MPVPAWILASVLASMGTMLARASDFVLTVDPNTVAECGHVQFNWEGGVPPYEITAIPEQHYASDIMVPNDIQMVDGKGSYQWMLPYQKMNPYTNAQQRIVFFMTDSRNIRTTATPLLTLGDVAAGMECTFVTGPTPPWRMRLLPNGDPSEYRQCEWMKFDWSAAPPTYTPVTMTAAVPNSTVIQFSSVPNATTMNWVANVQAGAQIVFAVWDAQKNQGGTSAVIPIMENTDQTCLGPGTLNMTLPAAAPSPTPTLATGVIAGIAAGASVGGLCLLALAVFFCLRHKRRAKTNTKEKLVVDDLHRHGMFPSPPLAHERLLRSHPGSPVTDHVMVYGPHGEPVWATPVHSVPSSGLESVSAPSSRTAPSTVPSHSHSYSQSHNPSYTHIPSYTHSPSNNNSNSQSQASGSVGSTSRTKSPITRPPAPTSTARTGSTTPTTEPSLKWTLVHGPPPSLDSYPNAHIHTSTNANSDSTEVSFAQHPGGYRFHQDGGLLQAAPAARNPAPRPAPPEPAPEPLDMPPLYNAAWRRTQSAIANANANANPNANANANANAQAPDRTL